MLRFWLSLFVLAALASSADAQDDRTMEVYSLSGLAPPRGSHLKQYHELRQGLLGAADTHASVERIELEDRAPKASVVEELIAEVVPGVAIRTVLGGRGLLVNASAAQHKKVAQLLDLLHTQCGTPFEVEVRYLSVRARDVDGGLRARLATGAATADDWKRLRDLDAKKGARGGVISAAHGRWSFYRAVRSVHYQPEFDVEIAQGSAVADPLTTTARDGVKAAMRPFLMQDGDVLLHVMASAGEINELRRFRIGASPGTTLPDKPMSHDFGNLEQIDYNGCATSTVLSLRPGAGPRVLVLGAPGEERWEILTFGVKRAPKPAPAGTLTVLPLGALAALDHGFRVGFHGEEDRADPFLQMRLIEEMPSFIDSNAIQEMLSAGMESRGQKGFLYETPWLHGGALLVRGGANEARMLQATIGALERMFVRPADVRIVFVTGDTAPDPAAVVGVLRGSMLPEIGASFAAYRQLEFVPDYEVEVAQQARIADPYSRAAYAGVFANVRVSRRGPRAYRMALELRVSALPDGVETIPHSSAELPPMQRAAARVRHLTPQLDLDDGTTAVIDLGTNPFTGDKPTRLFALVSVR